MSKPPTLVANVQVLRAVAALLVVIAHSVDVTIRQAGAGSTPGGALDNFGAAGVDLFFVISGFVIAHTAFVGARREAGAFAMQRLRRVVPLYFILSALAAIGQPIHGAQLIATLLFWPAIDAHVLSTPIMFIGWTLCFEMLFYAAATLALLRPGRIVVVALLLAYGTCMVLGAMTGLSVFRFLGNPLIVEFLFGVAIAHVALRLPAGLGGVAIAMGIAWFGVTIMLGLEGAAFDGPDVMSRILVWGVPSALIVLGAVLMMPWRPALIRTPLMVLGAASYSLYLVHGLALQLFERALTETQAGLPAVFIFALCIAISVAAGMLVYRFVERPMLGGGEHRPKPAPVLS